MRWEGREGGREGGGEEGGREEVRSLGPSMPFTSSRWRREAGRKDINEGRKYGRREEEGAGGWRKEGRGGGGREEHTSIQLLGGSDYRLVLNSKEVTHNEG
jgi:hypothetical protein